MNKINSLKNINQQTDLNKSEGSNQNTSSLRTSNSKLLESLQAQSQSLRGQAEVAKEVKSNKVQDRTEYMKDFDTSSKSSQESGDESLNQFQKSLELDSSSFFKKMEARMLKEEAKTRTGEVAEDLKMRAKEKIRESVVDSMNSRKADNKSQDELFNSQNFQFEASNSKDQASTADSEIVQADAEINTATSESTKLSSKASNASNVTRPVSGENTSSVTRPVSGQNTSSVTRSVSSQTAPNTVTRQVGNNTSNANNTGNISTQGGTPVLKNGRVVGKTFPGSGSPSSRVSQPTGDASNGAFIRKNQLDGNNFTPSGNPYLDAAKSKLAQIMQATLRASKSILPLVQLNKFYTHKSLAEEANKYLDAANISATVNDPNANKQELIFTKGTANTALGEANTGIAYWQQNSQGDKEAQNKTAEMVKPVA